MTYINNNEEYQQIVKDKHLIIVFESICSLSNYFIEKLNEMNFENIFFVEKSKNNILFNKLLTLTTPTIILNNKIIYPADIDSINKIIERNQ
jgi:hypothetical protein